jgi:hypothetical protein
MGHTVRIADHLYLGGKPHNGGLAIVVGKGRLEEGIAGKHNYDQKKDTNDH